MEWPERHILGASPSDQKQYEKPVAHERRTEQKPLNFANANRTSTPHINDRSALSLMAVSIPPGAATNGMAKARTAIPSEARTNDLKLFVALLALVRMTRMYE